MQFTNTLLLLSSAASSVMGAAHLVQVSVNSALTYSPNSIVAAVGDTVEFDFLNGVSFFFFT
jgi:plastocyanin